MLPAEERLDRGDAPRPQPNLRLVVEDELAALERPSELADHGEPADRVLVLGGVVDGVAPAGALGHVHRDVRALKQKVDRATVVGRERDPDAGIHLQGQLLEPEGFGEDTLDPLHQLADRGALQVGEDESELVAAKPRDRIAGAQAGAQTLAELAQQLVAARVADGVVDLLEPVEVHQQHSHGRVRALCVRERLCDAVVEEPAVRKIGQRVVQRLVRKLVLGLPALDELRHLAADRRERGRKLGVRLS